METQFSVNGNGKMSEGLVNGTNETDRLQLRSEAVQEILSRRQDFMTRWCLIIFFLILLAIITGTWFIKYPDIIKGNASLTAANAPKELVTRHDGKIVRLFTANDQQVRSGAMIAWLESTADHREMIELSGSLGQALYFLSAGLTEKVSGTFRHEFKELGEVQSDYRQFIKSLDQFNDYLVNGYYYQQKKKLVADYELLKKMRSSLQTQKTLHEHNLELMNETYNANDSLFRDMVISRQDLRDQDSRLTDRKIGIPQLETSILSNESQQIDKQKQIEELEHTISQQKGIFRQELQTLQSKVENWMQQYIVTAPVTGRITFIVPLQENQFIQAGKVVGYVNPPDSRFYAQVTLPQANFGRIATGQKVQLRFDAYPYQEFGFVEGRLDYISKIPTDSGFLATVALPSGLLTCDKKELQYRSGLRSQALIITKDMRLLERFYYNILSGMKK